MLAICQTQANACLHAKKMLQADPVAQQVITGRFKRDLKQSSSGSRDINMAKSKNLFAEERHLVVHSQKLLIKSVV